MWLKAKTAIKVSATQTLPEGATFEAEEHLASLDDVAELKALGAVEDTVPPQQPETPETPETPADESGDPAPGSKGKAKK